MATVAATQLTYTEQTKYSYLQAGRDILFVLCNLGENVTKMLQKIDTITIKKYNTKLRKNHMMCYRWENAVH